MTRKQVLLIVVLALCVTMVAAVTTITKTHIINSTVDNTPVGATTPSTGLFTTLKVQGNVGNKIVVTNGSGQLVEGSSSSGYDLYVTVSPGCTASNTCSISGLWPSGGFVDANYYVNCTPTSILSSAAVFYVSAKTATGFTITQTVIGLNNPGGFNSFDCHGHHN